MGAERVDGSGAPDGETRRVTVLPPLPEVLSEPFWDPELYRTRETRQAQWTALTEMARRMARDGLPARGFGEALAWLDESPARVP